MLKALKITPKSRLVGLEQFYATGLATSATVIEELPSQSDLSSADTRGTWFVQQFHGASKRLWIEQFVLPMSDSRALPLPVLGELSEYTHAWLSVREIAIQDLTRDFAPRQRQVDRLRASLAAAEEHLAALEACPIKPLPERDAADDPTERAKLEAEHRDEIRAMADNIKLATREVDLAFKDFSSTWSSLSSDKQKILDWQQEARSEAEKQLSADMDALTRMHNALALLKKFTVSLFEHVPEAETVTRKIGDSGVDPLAADDLRGVYANLTARYMNSNELGVATTILARLADKQKGRSLSNYMRGIDEFYQLMMRLAVYNITIGDLCAIIALANMDDAPREKFLESETALALTRENMGEGEIDSDAISTCSTKKEDKKMYSKLKVFTNKEEERDLRSSQLRSSSAGGSNGAATGKGATNTTKGVGANGATDRAGGSASAATDSTNSGVTKNQAQRLKKQAVKEAAQVYATTLCKADKSACYEYMWTGNCSKGNLCTYSHDKTIAVPSSNNNNKSKQQQTSASNQQQPQAGASSGGKKSTSGAAGKDVKNSNKNVICRDWVERGECSRGTHCRFMHPELKRQSATPKTDVSRSTAASVLFALGTDSTWHEESEEDEGEGIQMVVEEPSEPDVCMSAMLAPQRHVLGWDTMASVHVAKDLSVIPGARLLPTRRAAYGVGGCKSITHSGPSPVFGGMEMVYIEGGGTPNLMSLGRALQGGKMALFGEHGAVRFDVPPHLKEKMHQLVVEIEAAGLIEGTAVMKNHVYQETFGPAEGSSCWSCVTESSSHPSAAAADQGATTVAVEQEVDESAYAVTLSMYADRVRLDRVDDCIDFMVNAGLTKTALQAAVKPDGPLRGLPKAITKEKIDHYFQHIGKDIALQEAEIASAPLRHPVDYEPEVPSGPGAMVQIDNVDPSFSRMKASTELEEQDTETVTAARAAVKSTKKVVTSIGGFKDGVIAIDCATGFVELEGRVSKKDPHKVVERILKQWIVKIEIAEYRYGTGTPWGRSI